MADDERPVCAACGRIPGIISYGERRVFKWHNRLGGLACEGSDLTPTEVAAKVMGTPVHGAPQETPAEPVVQPPQG